MRYLALTAIMIVAPACGKTTGGAAAETPNQPATVVETASEDAAPSMKAARDARADMMAAGLTKAPERFVIRTRLDAPVNEVWAYISNHDNLVEYSGGTLQAVEVDRSGSNGTDGVGCKRTCSVGEDHFVEEVLFFRAPYAFAYSATENTWGLEGHLSALSLTPDGDSTMLEWTMFFNTADPAMVPMMSQNMEGMMRGKILPSLTKKFGGEVLPPG